MNWLAAFAALRFFLLSNSMIAKNCLSVDRVSH
jgi:hypothetical protein